MKALLDDLRSYEYVVIEMSPKLMTPNNNLVYMVYDLMGKEIFRDENIHDAIIRIDNKSWPITVYIFHLLNDSQIIKSVKLLFNNINR